MKFSFKKLGLLACAMAFTLTGCSDKETWTVTCPWAPSGVAAVVSQKAATLSTKYSKDLVLVAEAVKGDAATVNTWVLNNKKGDPSIVMAGEGLFSITQTIDPAKMKFSMDSFDYVENLYSAVFVLSSNAKLGVKSIKDLEKFITNSTDTISVAVNGATSSEAFLATALFVSMGAKDKLKLTPYSSAAEAAQAVSRNETMFAVSHQTQILEAYQQGGVNVIAAFDKEPLTVGPFAGVEGVGQYGLPYFKNRCFLLVPAGTDKEKIATLRTLYNEVLKDPEAKKWMEETMLIEVDPMTEDQYKEHVAAVKSIIEQYKDMVL